MTRIKLESVHDESRKLRLMLKAGGVIFTTMHYRVFYIVNLSTAMILLSYSIYHYRQSIEKIAAIVYNLFMCVNMMTFIVLGIVWPENFRMLIYGSDTSYNYESALLRKVLDKEVEQRKKTTRKFAKIIFILSALNVLFFSFMTIASAIRSHNPLSVFPCWFPYPLDRLWVQLLTVLWQESIVILKQCMVFGVIVKIFYMFSHTNQEIIVMKAALENIESRAVEMAKNLGMASGENVQSKVFEECCRRCVRMCAEHHTKLYRYLRSSVPIMNVIYSTIFVSGVMTCSFAGYFIISNNYALKIKYVVMALTVLFHNYVAFRFASVLTDALISVSETIYTLEWYRLPKECRSTLFIMLMQSNRPFCYNLLTGQQVDMEVYMMLVKTTYYYMNIMITL